MSSGRRGERNERHGAASGLSWPEAAGAGIWFESAIAEEPERTFVTVEGARVETLAWGKRGKPGLVFLHGGAAHADWWSFVAPFFARERRVVAPTFTGMGRSDWRQVYSFRPIRARGAGSGTGGRRLRGRAAHRRRPLVRRTRGDGPRRRFRRGASGRGDGRPAFLRASRICARRSPPRPTKERRIQHSLDAVVARFRLAPPQVCDNLFILDFIARRSAAEVVDAEGKHGWALCFDPHFWEKFTRIDPTALITAARSPLALIRGAKSQLFHPEDAAYLLSLIPPGSPYVEIPEAEHHVMIDQPIAFVAALRALLAAWPQASTQAR